MVLQECDFRQIKQLKLQFVFSLPILEKYLKINKAFSLLDLNPFFDLK